jgi:hypothetical protein
MVWRRSSTCGLVALKAVSPSNPERGLSDQGGPISRNPTRYGYAAAAGKGTLMGYDKVSGLELADAHNGLPSLLGMIPACALPVL